MSLLRLDYKKNQKTKTVASVIDVLSFSLEMPTMREVRCHVIRQSCGGVHMARDRGLPTTM